MENNGDGKARARSRMNSVGVYGVGATEQHRQAAGANDLVGHAADQQSLRAPAVRGHRDDVGPARVSAVEHRLRHAARGDDLLLDIDASLLRQQARPASG